MPPLASMHAVASTTVSPERTVHDPLACLARWPDSMTRVLPPMCMSLRCLMIFSFSLSVFVCLPACGAPGRRRAGEGTPAPNRGGLPPPRGEEKGDVSGGRGAGVAGRRVPVEGLLLADPQALDRLAVALEVLPLEVIEEAAAAADQLEQAAAAVVVLRMGLEVVRELRDAMGQERHLHLRRAAVVLVESVVLNDLLSRLCGLRQSKLLPFLHFGPRL